MRTMMQRTLSLLLTICLLLTMMPAAVLGEEIATDTDMREPEQNSLENTPAAQETPSPGGGQEVLQNAAVPMLLSPGITIGKAVSFTSENAFMLGETLKAALPDAEGEWSYQWYVNGAPVAGATEATYRPSFGSSDVTVYVQAKQGDETLTSGTVTLFAPFSVTMNMESKSISISLCSTFSSVFNNENFAIAVKNDGATIKTMPTKQMPGSVSLSDIGLPTTDEETIQFVLTKDGQSVGQLSVTIPAKSVPNNSDVVLNEVTGDSFQLRLSDRVTGIKVRKKDDDDYIVDTDNIIDGHLSVYVGISAAPEYIVYVRVQEEGKFESDFEQVMTVHLSIGTVTLSNYSPKVGDVVYADARIRPDVSPGTIILALNKDAQTTQIATGGWTGDAAGLFEIYDSGSVMVEPEYAGGQLQAQFNQGDYVIQSRLSDVIPVPEILVKANGQLLNKDGDSYIAYYGQTLTASVTNVSSAATQIWQWTNSEGHSDSATFVVDNKRTGWVNLFLTLYNKGNEIILSRHIKFCVAAPILTIDYENEEIHAYRSSDIVPSGYFLIWNNEKQPTDSVSIQPGSAEQTAKAYWGTEESAPPGETTTVIIPARPSAPATPNSHVSVYTITLQTDTPSDYTFALVDPNNTQASIMENNTGVFENLDENTTYAFRVRKNAVAGQSFASEWTDVFFVKTGARTSLTISSPVEMTYQPNLKVEDLPIVLKNGDEVVNLTYGTDYTITAPDPLVYPNWPNVGENYACTLSLTEAAQKKYIISEGSFKVNILPISIENATVTLKSDIYDGQVKSVEVSLNGTALLAGDYTVSLPDGGELKNAGTYTVQILGKGNYTGTKQVDLTIQPKSLTAAVSPDNDTTYNGTTNVDTEGWKVTLAGVVEGDRVSAAITSATIDDKNVGENKQAQVQLQLQGEEAGNYALKAADITVEPFELKKAKLTVTLKDIRWDYQGAKTAENAELIKYIEVSGAMPSSSPEAVLVDKLELDQATFGLRDEQGVWRALRPEETSSTWSVPVEDILNDDAKQNYEMPTAVTGFLYIHPIQLQVNLPTLTRVYDATNTISFTIPWNDDLLSAAVDMPEGETVSSICIEGTMDAPDAGENKPVHDVNVYAMTGDAPNYNYEVCLPTDAPTRVNITKKELRATVTAAEKYYDGLCNVEITVSDYAQDICGSDQVVVTGTGMSVSPDVGEQTVKVSFSVDNKNYSVMASNTPKVKINAKTLTITGNATLTYTGNRTFALNGIPGLSLYGVVDGENVDLNLTNATATIVDAETPNAGTGKRAIVQGAALSGSDAGNYTLPDAVFCTVDIVKATPIAIVWPTASEITYGDELSASTLTSTDQNGTFAWEKPETKLPAGEQKQTVVYSPKDAENYDYTSVDLTGEVSVKVNKAATVLDVSGVQTSYTYTGEQQTVNSGATLNHSEAAPVYANNTFTTVEEGNGLVVSISVPETANYLPAEATVTLTVKKAKAPTIEWPEAGPIIYGDPLGDIELKGGSSGLGTFVWQDGPEIPGAGTQLRKLVFIPKDTENYDWPETQLSRDITLQVAKRDVTITVADAEKTYGDPDPAWKYTVDGLLPGDALTITVTRTPGEFVDIYALDAEVAAQTNYEIHTVPGKLTILPRSLDDLTFGSIPAQRYTGQAQRPRPTIMDGDTELVPDIDYTLTYSGAVGPGKGKITITGKGNYTGECTITFDIYDPELEHLRNAVGNIGTGTTNRVVIDSQGLPMDYDLIDATGAGTDPNDRLLLIRANNDTDDTRILSLSGTQLNALVSRRTVRLLAFENAGAVAVFDARDLLSIASDVALTAEQRAQATYEVRIVPVTEPVAAIDISVWMCWLDGELELTQSLTTLQVGLVVDGADNRTDLCRLNDDGIPEVQDSELITLPADLLEEGTTMDWYHVTVLPDGNIQVTERQREPMSFVRLEVLSTSPAQGGRYLLQERSQGEQE